MPPMTLADAIEPSGHAAGPLEAMPLVSVIIPVFNGTNYLAAAIESVLAQTYRNREILVVDDGSTDGTWELMQKFAPRIRAFRKENGGVSSALNLGIQNASGRYVCWLSHDDLFMPDKLERQVGFMLQNPQFSVSHTDFIFVDRDGVALSKMAAPWLDRPTMLRMMFSDNHINGCTTIISKAVFDAVGFFNEELKFTQDLEMWIRILRRYEIGKLPIFSVKSRMHELQGSRIKNNLLREQRRLYERIFMDIQKNGWIQEAGPVKNFDKRQEFVWFADAMLKNKFASWLSLKYYVKALPHPPIRDSLQVGKKVFLLICRTTALLVKYLVRRMAGMISPARP